MIKEILDSLKTMRDDLFNVKMQEANPIVQGGFTPAILFVATLVLYVAYQLAMAPDWVLGGEMWAEMGTNYFPNASSPSYLHRLIATDAGYIPAPQRLIALVGEVFGLSAASIPYYYTWSGMIISAVMVGAFCLPRFRALVQSDALRFFTAMGILIVADFGLRTFINFTYFAAFFIAATTALALVDDAEEVPWWAWFIPILMVSKPAALAILPAMILAAAVSKTRFRRITIVTVVLSLGQLVQMVISRHNGTMTDDHDFTLLSKFIALNQYFFGLLGEYIAGPNFHLDKHQAIIAGLVFTLASVWVITEIKNKANALIIVGFSLLFFNVLLNTFALSGSWNRDMVQLSAPLHQHIIVGFFGCVMVMAGALVSVTDLVSSKFRFSAINVFAALAFAAWFVGTGWLATGKQMSRHPDSPVVNNSQWQIMAHAIDSGASPLCVPLDPVGWMYTRDCARLYPANLINPQDFHFERVSPANEAYTLSVTPPGSLAGNTLVSLAVLVRPLSADPSRVIVKAHIQMNDGSSKFYSGSRSLGDGGGLILLAGTENIPIRNISSIKFIFDSPVEIALNPKERGDVPAIYWMGK